MIYLFSDKRVFNPFPNKPWFLDVCTVILLKTRAEKEKLLVTSNFSFAHTCFLPSWRAFCHFHQIQNCKLFQFGRVVNSSFRKELRLFADGCLKRHWPCCHLILVHWMSFKILSAKWPCSWKSLLTLIVLKRPFYMCFFFLLNT